MSNKEFDVCIVGGLGHVGLPLGLSFAESGKRVLLYDINLKAMEMVQGGKMPFLESGAEAVLNKVLNKNLFVTNKKAAISTSHFVVVIIGTPVDEHLNPEFTIFKEFFNDIVSFIENDQHIILRSTVFPGTTEKIKDYLALKGKKIKISFCPERIAEGKAMEELRSLPQIVSAFDDISIKESTELFSSLTKEIITLDPIEAELAKLFTNVWRYIQFAISNQFYQLATQQGLDFYRIFNAITYNYPRTQSFPAAGFAAGPCLFKDTMQLASYSNNNFILGHIAMLINEGLPNFIVQHLKTKHNIKEKTIGILGMAFKGNSDDKRESLSYKLKKILEIEASKVLCTDVYINEFGFVSVSDLIKESDIIILAAPHKEYKNLDTDQKTVIDIWNFFGKGGSF